EARGIPFERPKRAYNEVGEKSRPPSRRSLPARGNRVPGFGYSCRRWRMVPLRAVFPKLGRSETVTERRADEDLMLDLKEGSEGAFAELMSRHRGPIVNFLNRLIGDRDRAEDLAHEVFLRVYRHAGTYRVTALFTTWLFTIASNLGKNELRN